MNPSSLDTQSGSTQDDHLARIVRLETNMDNVTTVLVNLQRTKEQHFQYTLTRLDDLRDRIDQAHANTQGEMNRLQDRIDQVHLHALERIERLQDRIDRNTRWLVGLMLANITAVAGLYVRMLLA
jgi:exonuclease III